ncbi:hypothetical protein X756_07130 [Mesorhizobium sp. LSHC412B00]|nr:hypothetical protein X756_07130 [Mesorhizobium sp. LSHC412B00]
MSCRTAATAIILPLLPNRTIDPWGGFNPWEVWLLTVLTASPRIAGSIAGPIKFWLPLVAATLIALMAGYGTMLLPPNS